jgi:predicted RNA-binding Zn-ribbon protein involved in translation (DUF1610 family)
MSLDKMICPKCGAEMNQHAVKVDYGEDHLTVVDDAFGGVLKEVHTCPQCGDTEMRVEK